MDVGSSNPETVTHPSFSRDKSSTLLAEVLAAVSTHLIRLDGQVHHLAEGTEYLWGSFFLRPATKKKLKSLQVPLTLYSYNVKTYSN
ncbi:hypothetical protein TNCT_692671 [Trichonephila clavata]|uniref:Uncharacterized protein n=1 Tax=Trichonephila clavata TaxID=2740835 RepID=A0A8X6M2D6_TRICU|nr:hypothetical protein TNCT_692671 [Trichonephila clavata]